MAEQKTETKPTPQPTQAAPLPVQPAQPQPAPGAPDAGETDGLINLTPLAQEKARVFLAEDDGEIGDKVLRVGVTSGGCSGFSYEVEVGEEKPGDHVQDYGDGLKLVCDAVGLQFLRNATVDYEDTIGHAGFKFENPIATGTCGCGTSFTVE